MKKPILLLSLLIVITLGLTAGSVYQYTHHKNVTNAAVLKAQKQRDDALNLASAYKLNMQSANTENTALATQKAQLCAALVTLKHPSTICAQ